MNDITEEMLVAQMKLGDQQAFAELYDRYKPSVYRTACLISGNAQDGEDIMQETFIKAFVHCKELKSNKMFRYWLFRILNRTAWQLINSKKSEIPDETVLEQADFFGQSADPDSGFDKILDRLQTQKMEDTRYTDLPKAESAAGVITNAPETFSNGYQFYGINMKSMSYETDDSTKVDSFKALSIEYRSGSDRVLYNVQPRPMMIEDADNRYESIEQDSVTYYYYELRNKWVPVGYEPTDEEKAQMDAGTLNIGVGASEISYSDSKGVIWEINGHEHHLFCMDNEISKEALISMALEIE